MKKHVEVCAASVQSALNAQLAGAHRVELCNALELGGITPSPATILMTRELLSIEVFVLIRPRPGDFYYSSLELEITKKDILFCKENGIDGVVIGMLDQNGEVPTELLSELITLAHPMQVTFHRAFDRTPDPFLALEKIIEAGAHRILTSGQKIAALEGKKTLNQLVKKANGRIVIMPGAGVNEKNIIELAESTEAEEFHLSGKAAIKSPIPSKTFSDNDYFETDIEKIRKVVDLLK